MQGNCTNTPIFSVLTQKKPQQMRLVFLVLVIAAFIALATSQVVSQTRIYCAQKSKYGSPTKQEIIEFIGTKFLIIYVRNKITNLINFRHQL